MDLSVALRYNMKLASFLLLIFAINSHAEESL